MEPIFEIEPVPERCGIVSLPPEAAGEAGRVAELTLEFGCRHEAVQWTGEAPPGRIGVSTDVLEHLHIPTDCPYRLKVSRRRVCIGPVVGILAARTRDQMTPDRLSGVANHLLNYDHLGGLFVAFARETLDFAGATVEGYRYCGSDRWEPGLFTIPRAIFRRFGVPLGERLAPLQRLGVQVVNERIFDKWEAARWLLADARVRSHVPETVLVAGPESVLTLLERHPCVFVKPIFGSQGKRILRARRCGAGYTLDIAGEGQVMCADRAELAGALRPRLPDYAIAQQGLTLVSAGGRLVDFRIMLLKDGTGRWTVPGIVSRCGASGHFVSNMATGGFPLPVERSLPLLFGPGSVLTFRRKLELTRLALAVGEALDRSGLLLGDIGLDVAYDLDDHPWVIEVNNRYPDHSIAWESGQWAMFYRTRALPMEFAAYLAGFGRGGAAGD